MQREDVMEYLQSVRDKNPTADLAFYTFRDMHTCDWKPFVKAAVERSPVSIEKTKSMDERQIYDWLTEMPEESIYDGKRLAQPDEVANYLTGDGLEKAFLLANVLRSRDPQHEIEIIDEDKTVTVKGSAEHRFQSEKQLRQTVQIQPDGRIETG
jgi:hypothetical protein